ncbi:uncharacterized protein LOC26528513 [Drosophila mojavensis]|uniref:uncharacterized protein LOC26528513 n=1 Tax=Drosophila mojavensis TaxID=7230 RepID=UPI001CD0762A|nr:uncharacterized protein LOC26528513 [Drosophila mojavensis]
MQLRQHNAPVTLTSLNDDCLLLICAQLSIKDQFALLRLGGRLRPLVLQIWQRKYASEFDWQQEPQQLEGLRASEQSQLLGHMARLTRALLNLNVWQAELPDWLQSKRKRKRKRQLEQKPVCMPNMQRLSFGACHSEALLRQLPRLCPNLTQLQLGGCVGVEAAQLCRALVQLPQLCHFELLPGSGICGATATPALADIEYCQTLQTLKIPACALRAASKEIAQLPQLRQLTGFLCCSGDIDNADKEKANAGGLATATVSACLAALGRGGVGGVNGVGGVGGAARQIVALRLQCQLDGSLPRLLAGHLSVVQLQRFAWHSQLMVHYDATDGSIKWLPQALHVPRALLRFIVSQSASLRELDFTRNVHATPTFLAQLAEQMGGTVAVRHDGCPRGRMCTQETDMDNNRNDLAFVEFAIEAVA